MVDRRLLRFNPFFIRASVYWKVFNAVSRRFKNVSIPSSSGHQFTGIRITLIRCSPMRMVSIPSSSGHQFTAIRIIIYLPFMAFTGFNPFFIRASVYCIPTHAGEFIPGDCVSIPSSSGHQFTANQFGTVRDWQKLVSIPSSSGHQFTENQLATSWTMQGNTFQSLLHQGISLLHGSVIRLLQRLRLCFNPFFIRASVYCALQAMGRTLELGGFNPFFIRASVYWKARLSCPERQQAMFQSLLHQGISLLGRKIVFANQRRQRFNPFFIRASVYCSGGNRERYGPTFTVSIPSSSGHQFTACAKSGTRRFSGMRFNPFFIRASVYCSFGWEATEEDKAIVSIPSSSGHQFTA